MKKITEFQFVLGLTKAAAIYFLLLALVTFSVSMLALANVSYVSGIVLRNTQRREEKE